MRATHTAVVNFSDELINKPRDNDGDCIDDDIASEMFELQGQEILLVSGAVIAPFEWSDVSGGWSYMSEWLKDIKEIK